MDPHTARVTILAFKSPRCAPCRALAPVLEQLTARYQDRVEVRVVDTEVDPATADRYHVRSVPTLIAVVGEAVFEQQLGYSGRERVEALFERAAQSA